MSQRVAGRASKKNVLFFNPYHGGHYFEYVAHVLNYLSEHPQEKGLRIVFYVPAEYKTRLSPRQKEAPDVEICYCDEPIARYTELALDRQPSVIRDLCQEFEIEKIFFPHLERAAAILPQLRLPHVRFAGIYFSLFHRISLRNYPLPTRFFRTMKAWVANHWRLYSLFGRHPWDEVLILNDTEAPAAHQRLPFLRPRFSCIVDPIPNAPESENAIDVRNVFGFPDDARVVACVGDFRYRKNVLNVVRSFAHLRERRDIYLLILGGGLEEYLSQLAQLVEQQENDHIVFRRCHLDECEFDAVVSQSDVLAIPYIDYFRSSGILNHGVRCRTPLLCSNVGLMGQLVQEYELGATVNPLSPDAIAGGILSVLRSGRISDECAIRFSQERKATPDDFARTILDSL